MRPKTPSDGPDADERLFFTQSDQSRARLLVGLIHDLYLLVPLIQFELIDADGVDPQPP
jgi:hypothetical protein